MTRWNVGKAVGSASASTSVTVTPTVRARLTYWRHFLRRSDHRAASSARRSTTLVTLGWTSGAGRQPRLRSDLAAGARRDRSAHPARSPGRSGRGPPRPGRRPAPTRRSAGPPRGRPGLRGPSGWRADRAGRRRRSRARPLGRRRRIRAPTRHRPPCGDLDESARPAVGGLHPCPAGRLEIGRQRVVGDERVPDAVARSPSRSIVMTPPDGRAPARRAEASWPARRAGTPGSGRDRRARPARTPGRSPRGGPGGLAATRPRARTRS